MKHATQYETRLISTVARRAVIEASAIGVNLDHMTVMMDLDAAHANGCPLDLVGLQTCNVSDLLHDIGGINRHLDHDTGALTDCFVPRCAS